jgi:hypothetical protein
LRANIDNLKLKNTLGSYFIFKVYRFKNKIII